MRNVQQRVIDAPIEVVGPIVDTVSGPDDKVWPAHWPPITLDRGLEVGSKGGHGPIRYSVSEYEPGRRVRFVPAPGLGLAGYHEFTVTPQPNNRSLLTHVIEAKLYGRMRVLWPLAILWIHEAVLQDLLDKVERNATGTLTGEPARWSPWVRTLRRLSAPRGAKLPR